MKNHKEPEPVLFKKFAAIDFETADYGRDSACAVSVCIAEKGTIVHKEYALIKPPRRDFIFSYLHGITWNRVVKKPLFRDVWRKIGPLCEDIDFFAAHNASFDRMVLHACCKEARLNPPSVPFLCTMRLARRVWNIYPTKLPDVCRRLKIPLKHHDAKSDALACARIVLEGLPDGLPKDAFLPNKKTAGRGRAIVR